MMLAAMVVDVLREVVLSERLRVCDDIFVFEGVWAEKDLPAVSDTQGKA
jgi:hypothetical protein